MKKSYLALAIGIMLGCATISTHINASQNICIRNNYGATIAAKVTWPNPQDDKPEVRIEDGATVIIDSRYQFRQWGLGLSIRTTGVGSTALSPYTNIKSYVDQIIKDNRDTRYAIITIKPGTYMNPWWNIEVSYEN